MADDRPMAEQLQAPTGGFESAIVVPIINAQNFELKSSLINLVQNRIFRGGNDEEPHAHIRHFESITNNQRYPDVPNTTIKLLLFPFSLDGVAKTWLDKEPPNSILTWDDLVSKFINFFFPPSKTTNLRNEITNFRQIAQESFSEAWERFKELLRKCPHHGFSLMHQLDTFYNSLSYNDQDSLNSAAGGNFLYKSPNEGLQIIENKAKVRCSRNAVMRVKTASLEDKMTIKMNKIMNEMKALVVTTPAPIKAVEERCTTCGNNHSSNVCPMTRGGYEYPVYHDNFQQFQQTASVGNFVQNGNSGYRAPNLANQMRPPGFNQPNPQVSPTRYFLQLILQCLKSCFMLVTPFKGDFNLSEFGHWLSNFRKSFDELLIQGTLPSNTIPNPRNECKGITTRSGVVLDGPLPPMPPPFVNPDNEVGKETEVTKDQVQLNSSQRTKNRERDDILASKFIEIFRDLHFELSFADALVHMPKFALMIKKLLSNKDKLIEITKTPMNANCSAVILKKLPEKLGDPGRFLIPCDFGEFDNYLALAVSWLQDHSHALVYLEETWTSCLYKPFLSTAHALIDVYEGEIILRHDDSESVNRMDLIDATCAEYAPKVLDFIKSGDSTSIILDPPPFTPFEGSEMLLEQEIEEFLESDESLDMNLQDDFNNKDDDVVYLESLLEVLNDDPFSEFSPEKKINNVESVKTSIEEPPDLELKDLPAHLEYTFLEKDKKLPVIISKDLKEDEKVKLIEVLKAHKSALAWKISDIKGIDPK
ncbi:reverse transcriptase domain-containing protein [Tanacetum coccineum]